MPINDKTKPSKWGNLTNLGELNLKPDLEFLLWFWFLAYAALVLVPRLAALVPRLCSSAKTSDLVWCIRNSKIAAATDEGHMGLNNSSVERGYGMIGSGSPEHMV
jgi:hypothetical protein